MKNSYPIILTPDSTGYVVDIPDFQIGTQGDSIPEAMENGTGRHWANGH